MVQTILVTGGAGYIGSHVCKALKRKGYNPITYDNLCSGNREAVKWGPFEEGDVRDKARLSEVIRRYSPAAIMHFAALIQVGDSVLNPAIFYDNNVNGSLVLLDASRENGVDFMVFSSTAAVYGIPDCNSIPETHALKPINPYGHTKLAMESMIRDFSSAYGMRHAILRYFNAAGADPDCETGTAYKKDTHIIPLLMNVAAGAMSEFKVFGTDYNTPDGTAIRDYIHVCDLADAHILALETIMGSENNLTLNLGTSMGRSVIEILESAKKVTGREIPASFSARRPGDPDILVADASKATELLGWTPRFSNIDDIIGTAWAWRESVMCAKAKTA